MLDEKIVNILRRRNMKGNQRTDSKKWQQAISTVEWISARFPYTSKYQIITFNENCKSLSKDGNLRWLSTSDAINWKNCKKNEQNQPRGWDKFI